MRMIEKYEASDSFLVRQMYNNVTEYRFLLQFSGSSLKFFAEY